MSYLLPSFLPSLALASIPGILYLLFRRRRNDVDWGATYVLKLTLQSKSRQNFWKQMAILALRTLFLALLVLGFARPFLRRDERGAGPQAYPHGPGTLHRIVLFDNSQSMTALHESVTRADAARAVLRDLMLSTLAGDTFHLVLLCPEKPDDTDLPVREYSCPIPERKVQECQSGLGLVPASAELEAGLRKAKELFSGLSSTNRQLILLSDLTRKDFPSLAGYPPLGEALNSLKVQFAALFLGKASARNLALESLTFGTDLLLRGQPTHLHLTVMNYSEMPSTEGFLSLLVDGKPFMEMPCALSPNQRKTFEFPFVPEGSAHRIEARLGEDAYAPDNHLERSVDVRDRLRVLVVRRDEPAPENPFEADTEFLERALRLPERVIKEGPLKEQQFDEGTLWIRRQHGLSTGPASRSESDLAYQIGYTVSWSSLPRSQVTSTELERQDLLLFSEIDRLGEPIRRSLVSFLRRGGSLLAGLGPRVEAEAFNETFHDILPYALDRPFRDPFEKPNYERFLNIQPTDLTLPLLKEFERPVNGDIADGRIYNHFRLMLPATPDPSLVLLTLSNGDPLLVQHRAGKGIALLWTSTLGGSWHSLVVHQAYVPLLVRLLNYAISFRPLSRNLVAGEPLIHEVTEIEGDLYLSTPDFRLVSCPRIPQGNREFVRFENTRVPGAYELQRDGGQTLALFFVTQPDRESDIRPISASLEKDLIARLRLRLPEDPAAAGLPTSAEGLKRSLWHRGEGDEITTWMLLAVLLLFLLDASLVKAWFS